MSTFVSVGNANQPFTRLLNAVAGMIERLPQPVVVQHGHTPFLCTGCEVVDFVDADRFETLVGQSDLLIFHAGAGSIITSLRLGKIPVVMPRLAAFGEHVNDHQNELAQELSKVGKVIVAERPADLAAMVEKALTLKLGAAKNSGGHRLCMVDLVATELAKYEKILELDRGSH